MLSSRNMYFPFITKMDMWIICNFWGKIFTIWKNIPMLGYSTIYSEFAFSIQLKLQIYHLQSLPSYGAEYLGNQGIKLTVRYCIEGNSSNCWSDHWGDKNSALYNIYIIHIAYHWVRYCNVSNNGRRIPKDPIIVMY